MGNTKDGMWKWDLAWRRSLFEWEADSAEELNVMIKDTRISPGSPDKWLWTHNNDGKYSTKSAYSMLIKDHDGLNEASTFKRVWNPILPNKIAAFNWQVLLNRIPTKLNLLKRGCAKGWAKGWEDSKCVMCEAEGEDSDHLFLKCRLVKWLWKACAAWWGINVRLENNCWDTFKKLGERNKDSRIKEGWDCIWNALLTVEGKGKERAGHIKRDSKHPEFIGFGQKSEKWKNCKRGQKPDMGVVSTPYYRHQDSDTYVVSTPHRMAN
ncbi:hypothetical protein SLEP1_g17314 [Rubroshorea leprosula]|uniref:Reverse transcriptase zinc-binding domain-containing protein n=1 Tax=Rubroshorea leprosula TaxID=152421 RepID=A0AAV5IZD6_9ROSI|nr:hypothetical protein SLEP1_g17314 [Rubroshorea leprosula]